MAENENPRVAIREARARRLRLIDGPKATVTVYPASDDLREVLRHVNGTRFRASLDQGVEWPNDSFTARRIADGSVRTSPASEMSSLARGGAQAAAPDPTQNPREHAEAKKPTPESKPESKAESKPESKQQRQQPNPQPAT